MNLLFRFQQYIQQHHLFQPKDQLLLAVSGGVDSIVLVDLCHKTGYRFSIAHCNFQLRGEESDADETFVHLLGEKYNVEVLVKKFDTAAYATEKKLSIQEAARVLRYEWFEEIRSKNKYQYILTAHHAADSVETILLQLTRGTGMAGMGYTWLEAGAEPVARPGVLAVVMPLKEVL